MGSLLPGWDDQKADDFLQHAKAKQRSEVPEWLAEIRKGQASCETAPRRWKTIGHAATVPPAAASVSGATPDRLSDGVNGTLTPNAGQPASPVSDDPFAGWRNKRFDSFRGVKVPALQRASMPARVLDTDDPRDDAAPDPFAKPPTSSDNLGLLEDHIQWWKHMNSSVYNRPDTSVREDYARGSYVPQFETARAHRKACLFPNEELLGPLAPADVNAADTAQ